ncbi:hypothetical protein BUALT_Bualt11G0001300 [Buddleja alternifolia]|uniref:Reverse transcriptase domain-containing protein n=1 Tax=Buddleja alternifolia TaxID=168488 RepID=A0AAV6X283_9LAMI|nr:hypothetical protein BUALT_Bualt11G0001300 [Buddleja alternifolia]
MERLSYMIDEAVQRKDWVPVSVCRGGPKISHMFFADDIILVAKTRTKCANSIKSILDQFCSASGLKISLNKSKVFYAPKTRTEIQQEMTCILAIGSTRHLGKYLGVNVLHSRNTCANYRELVDKVQNRLSSWKAKNLNLAARATLIQSVTSALPTYAMHTNWIPNKVCNHLDKLNRAFLWGSNEGARKVHLVGWDKVIRDKAHGGLGIRESRRANIAMLAKTGWHERLVTWRLPPQGLQAMMSEELEFTNST